MTALDATLAIDVHIAADHPAFAGHFPGSPVLPGVLLAALVFEAVRDSPAHAARLGDTVRIEQLKFLVPVRPGASLRINLRPQGHGFAFDICQAATAVVARGVLGAGSDA
jgi:3-hydroxymyristoyl/3-hydroxydecanoyl-(acyl carrier protein) dehydratase